MNRKTIAFSCFALNLFLVSVGAAADNDVNNRLIEERETTNKIVDSAPDNAINGLRTVEKYVATYRIRNQGKYPESASVLIREMFRVTEETAQQFSPEMLSNVTRPLINPDNKEADDPSTRNRPTAAISYIVLGHRLDGAPLGSPKMANTRDLVALTDIYSHYKGIEVNGGVVSWASGFYVVLWDDSKIEAIPIDSVLFYPTTKSEGEQAFTLAFPGQAGVTGNCITYEESEIILTRTSDIPLNKPILKSEKVPVRDNGGPESLVAFSRLLNTPSQFGIAREKLWTVFDPAQAEYTLEDITQGAGGLGVTLQQRKLNLADLEKLNSPAILFLSDASRIITLANLDENEAIVVDRGQTHVINRDLLAKRYRGEALIAKVATNAPEDAPRVLVEDPIRRIEVKVREADIKQQVKITNIGQTPLTLQIERPIPGGKEAELSNGSVAPGQSTTLSLTLKWRDVLKSDTQNIFVFLRTNDPLRPRLQLGFHLNLPENQSSTSPAP